MADVALSRDVGAVTGRGRRSVNQDAVMAVRLPCGGELVAVADGMGGHSAGEVASRIALEVLRTAVEAGNDLASAVVAANAAVYEEAASLPGREGMGTTLVAALRRGSRYIIANVGDSRAYRIDESGVHQLTTDHSFVAEAVGSGELTAEEAGASRWRNAVTRAIGTDRTVEVDCHGPFGADEPHTLLLCTDGLYRFVDDDALVRAARASQPGPAARDLAGAAFAAGSDDNISVAIVQYGTHEAAGAVRATAAVGTAVPAPAVLQAQDAVPAGRVREVPRAAPTLTDDDPAVRGRRRSRRRRPSRRWHAIEVGAVLLALIGVIVYVTILASVF
jgi:PPM family protein phosphatase